MARYYDSEGSRDPLRITLADSGYVPRFIPAAGDFGSGSYRRSLKTRETEARRPNWVLAVIVALSLLLCAVLVAIATRRFTSGKVVAPSSSAVIPAPVAALVPDQVLRIAVGSSDPKLADSAGNPWMSDRYFRGGIAVSRTDRRILGSPEVLLLRTARAGEFQYDIPLRLGRYELHLHFAEIMFLGQSSVDSDGVGKRRFDVWMNDQALLRGFDIVRDAGGAALADEKVFKSVSPAADGHLHLRFVGNALLNAIELYPQEGARVRPLRILAGPAARIDSRDNVWGPDRHYLGGGFTRMWTLVKDTPDPELYSSNRWGNFSYSIPVADGTYGITLRFAELYFGDGNSGGGGIGSRVFDVYCNGTTLLKDFDILKEAGGPNRALEKVFHGVKPNPVGKLVISFIPKRDNACVYGIEVVDETP